MVLWIEEHGMCIHMLCICVFPAALECHGPWPLGETWRLGRREGDSTSSRLPDPDAGTAAKDVSTGSVTSQGSARMEGDTGAGSISVDARRGRLQVNIQTWPHLPTHGLGTFTSSLEVNISPLRGKE